MYTGLVRPGRARLSHITRKGKDAVYEFEATDILKNPALPLTAYFDPAYGLSTKRRAGDGG